MSNYRFMIYAEGGSKTFMGHLMRTVALAVTFRSSGIEVIFVTSSEDGETYISENGFKVIRVEQLDYSALAHIAKQYNIDGIMVDRFGYTIEQHQILVQEIGLLVQIDDFLYDGPAQLVINSTIDEKPTGRNGRWLCGGKYAIIREKFVNHDKVILDIPRCMLLTTGYGDPGNVHIKMIEMVQSVFPDLVMHVIVGGGYKTKEQLREIASKNTKVILYENITDISGIMQKADFAISAAGTTLSELAAAGVPAIAFSLYDNQLDNIQRVSQKGSIIPIGWYEDIDYVRLKNQVTELYKNSDMRKKLSANGLSWIDGKGTERIAEAVLEELQRHEKGSYCDNKVMEH